jgi:hypothetical protein
MRTYAGDVYKVDTYRVPRVIGRVVDTVTVLRTRREYVVVYSPRLCATVRIPVRELGELVARSHPVPRPGYRVERLEDGMLSYDCQRCGHSDLEPEDARRHQREHDEKGEGVLCPRKPRKCS